MIRHWNKPTRKGLWIGSLVMVFALAFCSVVDVARAGDGDGITGYSMRLKNKSLDGSDSSGGSQLGLTPDAKTAHPPIIQEASKNAPTLASRISLLFDWRSFVRMFSPRL